jgi:hypothetical protein
VGEDLQSVCRHRPSQSRRGPTRQRNSRAAVLIMASANRSNTGVCSFHCCQ